MRIVGGTKEFSVFPVPSEGENGRGKGLGRDVPEGSWGPVQTEMQDI